MSAPPSSPDSPETKARTESYTPSNEDVQKVAFFGRRRLRIMHGQSPNRHAHKFTPPEMKRHLLVKDICPTDEEAELWAKETIAAARAPKQQKTSGLLFPSPVGTSSTTPVTSLVPGAPNLELEMPAAMQPLA